MMRRMRKRMRNLQSSLSIRRRYLKMRRRKRRRRRMKIMLLLLWDSLNLICQLSLVRLVPM
jgi:hypothetical protein